MSTFYVLPSRNVVGQRLGDWLGTLLPGIRYTPWDWPDLAEGVKAQLEAHADVFIIFREDLPEGAPLREALSDQFGMEADDEVLEIDLRTQNGMRHPVRLVA